MHRCPHALSHTYKCVCVCIFSILFVLFCCVQKHWEVWWRIARSCDMFPVYTALHNNYPADALCVCLQYVWIQYCTPVCLGLWVLARLFVCLPANGLLPCYIIDLIPGPYSIMLIQSENIVFQISGQWWAVWQRCCFYWNQTALHVEW